jgi:tetratricopeptide (TPR) repeat protein
LLNRAGLFEISLPFRYSSRSKQDPTKTGVGLSDIVVSVYSAAFGECNCLPHEPPVPLGGTGKDAATPSGSNALSHAKLTRDQERQAAAQEEFLRSVLGGAFADLATVEAMQEQYAVALGHYQEAEGWDPKVPNLMRNLGFTAYRAGNPPEAIRALRKALALAPGDDAARAVLRELGTTVPGQVPQKKEDKKP